MSNTFENFELGDLIEFQRGYDLPKSDFKNGKVPVISSNGILGYHNEIKVKAPGITIGRSGTVGLPHLINEDFFPHNTSLFIKDFKGNNVLYIYYLLKSLKLNEYKSGSGVPTMNRNHLHPIKIYGTKSTKTQQKIAAVLSALDDKIEVNNKINVELEAMAKTLYDYWFVQFEFPITNESHPELVSGSHPKGYKSAGGKMVYNPTLKREIPEGWEVNKFKFLVNKVSNTINPDEYLNLKYLPIDKIPKKSFLYSEYEDRNNALSSLIKFDEDDILLGAMRVYFHRVCLALESGISRNTIFVLRAKNEIYKFYSLMLLNKDESIQFANDNSTGSSIPYAKWDNGLAELNCIIPPNNLLKDFNVLLFPILEKVKNLSKQNQELAQLRDWLLPMLMNGQVSVE